MKRLKIQLIPTNRTEDNTAIPNSYLSKIQKEVDNLRLELSSIIGTEISNDLASEINGIKGQLSQLLPAYIVDVTTDETGKTIISGSYDEVLEAYKSGRNVLIHEGDNYATIVGLGSDGMLYTYFSLYGMNTINTVALTKDSWT